MGQIAILHLYCMVHTCLLNSMQFHNIQEVPNFLNTKNGANHSKINNCKLFPVLLMKRRLNDISSILQY